MANRYFNKQTTNARQALAQGGPAGPRAGRTSIPEFPKQPNPGPKGLPRRSFDNTDKSPKPKSFDNTDKTDREKIIKDKIRRNKIKDRLDKLKGNMKVGPIGAGLNPDKIKKSIKNLKDQMAKKQRQADYMKKHGKKAPRRKTLSVRNSYKKQVEGLK